MLMMLGGGCGLWGPADAHDAGRGCSSLGTRGPS